MGSSINYIALCGVHQSVSDLSKQLNTYGNVGFVIDGKYAPPQEIWHNLNHDIEDAELENGSQLPDVWFEARGVSRNDLAEVHALKLPGDPYMHVWLYSWTNLITESQWPQKFNQIGSRGLTLLFDDAEAELVRLLKQFPETRVLHQPLNIHRKWGKTTSILVQDPEGTFVELISINDNPLLAKAKKPQPHQRSFLHFMMNCVEFSQTTEWYQSFGMAHDSGVDFRDLCPDEQFNCGIGGKKRFLHQMQNYSHHENVWIDCHFLRGSRDPSHMHLELLDYETPATLKDPGLNPTWFQKGIARYCMKTPSFADARRDMEERGYKIYIDEQRGSLTWGDSQWFFFGDHDGNLLTLEQWYPLRAWGERS